jgi:serine/threonine protein phosphatase PrpC
MPNNEDHSGSTAVTAFVTPTHIVVANCGDSRALLVGSDGSALFASEDHKPYSDEEKRRIEGAGGTVSMKRVNGDLAVSRALGDFVYKQNKPDGSTLAPPDNQQVSCIPEVTIIERRADMAFLLLCCDGIWDVMTNEQVARLVVEVRGGPCPLAAAASACQLLSAVPAALSQPHNLTRRPANLPPQTPLLAVDGQGRGL